MRPTVRSADPALRSTAVQHATKTTVTRHIVGAAVAVAVAVAVTAAVVVVVVVAVVG